MAGLRVCTYLKVCIFDSHVQDVNGLHLATAGADLLRVHVVDQRLYQGSFLDAAHVKAIHIVPKVNLLLPVTNQVVTSQRPLVLSVQALARLISKC